VQSDFFLVRVQSDFFDVAEVKRMRSGSRFHSGGNLWYARPWEFLYILRRVGRHFTTVLLQSHVERQAANVATVHSSCLEARVYFELGVTGMDSQRIGTLLRLG
jgi:hypothetical protein